MRIRIVAAAALLAASLLTPGTPARAEEPAPTPATVALDWNATAVAAVRAFKVSDPAGTKPRPLYQTEGLLYMSYVQAAVYDAATRIDPRYEPYHRFDAPADGASLQAAVIAAAYNTLTDYLGDPDGSLAAKYAASIAGLPDDRATARGIAVGQAAAADIVALRLHDGRDAPSPTDLGAGPLQPGLWVWAPAPSAQIDQTPWLAVMQPFMLESTSQFRAPAPPALTSAQYANDLNETKAYGSASSTVRKPEQTAIAYFWNANAINQLNQTLQNVAAQHNMDLIDTTRVLAMGNMISTDAGMACFDSKYTYLRWRPITAIQNANLDGNPATTPDPNWTPLLTTPNHPEYPSQHGCVTSALAQVIADAVDQRAPRADQHDAWCDQDQEPLRCRRDTGIIDVTVPGAQGGATNLTTSQTFATVDDLETQLVNARVWVGFHFRTSVIAGEKLGTAVANWELQRYFQPAGDQDH